MKVETSAPTMILRGDHLKAGEVFATRYEVLSLLGEGGMGAVYKVRDVELDECVALKLLRPEVERVPGALERFRREVKLARKVTHPNVARTYDLGTLGASRYLTMEFIEGVALCDRPAAKMSLADTLRIGADVCRGLAAAHAAGVVHRDLKPDNVMIDGVLTEMGLTGEARVAITDFGVARLAESAASEVQSGPNRALTMGAVVGTPAYMAPEQVVGKDLDGRADIFALGVMLYELLTGTLPYDGETAYAMAVARLSGAARDVRELDQTVPAAVAELVAAAMSVRRDDRPDAQRMLQVLEALRGGAVLTNAGAQPGPDGASVESTRVEASYGVGAVPRSVAVMPFEVDPSDTNGTVLARQLAGAVADALTKLRALKVVPPNVSGVIEGGGDGRRATDPMFVAKTSRVERVLAGDVRTAGARVRVNLRLIDPSVGAQTWAERYDGEVSDGFALEDLVVRGASQALRSTLTIDDNTSAALPSEPAVRALFERARGLYHRFSEPGALRESVELLRQANAMSPGDGLLMSALGAALMRTSLSTSGDDTAVEAEDWALRALAIDPSIAETYVTLGLVRLHQGNLTAAFRAFRAALAKNPRNAEANSYVGRFLSEAGRASEGVSKIEFALRLDPAIQRAWWDLARTYALLGEDAKADMALRRGEAAGNGEDASFIARARIAMWRRDVDTARALVENIQTSSRREASPPRDALLPTLQSMIARGGVPDPSTDTSPVVAEFVRSPANRTFVWQMSTEVRAAGGDLDGALSSLDRAAGLVLTDVLWLDRCPVLVALRERPGFARVRAVVAARAADLVGF